MARRKRRPQGHPTRVAPRREAPRRRGSPEEQARASGPPGVWRQLMEEWSTGHPLYPLARVIDRQVAAGDYEGARLGSEMLLDLETARVEGHIRVDQVGCCIEVTALNTLGTRLLDASRLKFTVAAA